jgi:hypothetical protein
VNDSGVQAAMPTARERGGHDFRDRQQAHRGVIRMLFALFYVLAITILILHFTGFLARHNLEWLVLLLAVAVFPAVIYL